MPAYGSPTFPGQHPKVFPIEGFDTFTLKYFPAPPTPVVQLYKPPKLPQFAPLGPYNSNLTCTNP